jgi:hypothetical protein
MIKLEQLQRGRVYRLQSRNLECGVWNGKNAFIGIRTKFGLRFLDMEIHWGLSKTFGTAQALETMGTIPESISLNISLGTECGNCHKSLNYVKHHAEQKMRQDWTALVSLILMFSAATSCRRIPNTSCSNGQLNSRFPQSFSARGPSARPASLTISHARR